MSKIASFFLGETPDAFGRYFDSFLEYSPFWLEHDHKYIQLLFPIDSGTKFNRHAPLVTDEDRAQFAGSATLQKRHLQALDLLLGFWGLIRHGEQVSSNKPLSPADHVWLKRQDHNQLRITRAIRSLSLLGNHAVATSLAECVIAAGQQFDSVSDTTLEFWRSALLTD